MKANAKNPVPVLQPESGAPPGARADGNNLLQGWIGNYLSRQRLNDVRALGVGVSRRVEML